MSTPTAIDILKRVDQLIREGTTVSLCRWGTDRSETHEVTEVRFFDTETKRHGQAITEAGIFCYDSGDSSVETLENEVIGIISVFAPSGNHFIDTYERV